jgi:3-methylcrotonyl-CoA carboxylase beta subunit
VGKKRTLSQLQNPSPEAIAAAEANFKGSVLDQYIRESSPYYATARLWDDGILDPLQTRMALALAFTVAANAPLPKDRFGTFRM